MTAKEEVIWIYHRRARIMVEDAIKKLRESKDISRQKRLFFEATAYVELMLELDLVGRDECMELHNQILDAYTICDR